MNNTGTSQHLDLYEKISAGDRIALSRAITLIESRQPDHISVANALLDHCMQQVSGHEAMRLAISGPPGVGKSTLIETISSLILGEGLKVAVLAIDPSSQLSGGSILGDKTRMQTLASHPHAYVRPSPAGAHQGGVAHRTREAVILCETAGYDVVIVETVGVGQSETRVRTMVDLLALLIPPAGGDEIQGIKRGILELADIVIINKADGGLLAQARETQARYAQALRVLHTRDTIPEVLLCSAQEGTHVDEVWRSLHTLFEHMQGASLKELRNTQNLTWFEHRLQQEILDALVSHPAIAKAYAQYKNEIATQGISVRSALTEMAELVRNLLNQGDHPAQ